MAKMVKYWIFLVICFASCNNSSDLYDENYFYFDNGAGYSLKPKNDHLTTSYIPPMIVKIQRDKDYLSIIQIPDITSTRYFLGSVLYSKFLIYLQSKRSDTNSTYSEPILSHEPDSEIVNLLYKKKISPSNSSQDISIVYEIVDSLLLHSDKFARLVQNDTNYWILNTKVDSIYGPLTNKEFRKTSIKLGISGISS